MREEGQTHLMNLILKILMMNCHRQEILREWFSKIEAQDRIVSRTDGQGQRKSIRKIRMPMHHFDQILARVQQDQTIS